MTISIMNKRDTKNLLFFDINPNKIFNKFYHTGSFLARSALSWSDFCPILVPTSPNRSEIFKILIVLVRSGPRF